MLKLINRNILIAIIAAHSLVEKVGSAMAKNKELAPQPSE
jgi:hypothetical protein